MPELPEVETVSRGLGNAIAGKTLAGAEVFLPKVAVHQHDRPFGDVLSGDRVESVGRRGKYVVVELGSRRRLVISLRMTGRLIVQPAGTEELHPYTNVLLRFCDGTRVCFADVRQFGRMRLVEDGDLWDAALGIEPLGEGFTAERFIAMLDGRRTPIKALLLDQSRIAGIGNIYACEALWQARIRPGTPALRLTKPARRRLHEAIRDVLTRAVALRGTTVDDYVDAEGLRGGFQNVLSVYGRLGGSCARCGQPIVRTVLAQRGTWWCRSCQR